MMNKMKNTIENMKNILLVMNLMLIKNQLKRKQLQMKNKMKTIENTMKILMVMNLMLIKNQLT